MIIGKLINDRYKVVGKIDEGGMANIFLATDTVFEKEVVLKILKEEFYDEKYIKQFKHEVESLTELSHENIIKVFDYCEVDNMYFIVMEYLDGITLKDLIRKKTTISPQMTVDIISKVSAALKHAHSFGLIHRDLKPQNIMILKDATIKLMDFGISEHEDELKEFDENDDSNSVMGSVHYISPEQVRGEKIDIRSDIYALGIVMYEMLVGTVPYSGKNAVDIALMHLKQHIGNISEKNPLVPQSLSNVVIRATSPDIKLRHQDIQSFEYDLTTCLMPNRLNEEILNFVDQSKEDSLSKTQLIDLNNEKIREEINKEKQKDNIIENEDWDWKKIAIIGGLITFLCIALLFIYGSSSNNLMPDLNGKTFNEAKEIIENELDVSLGTSNINYKKSDKVSEGRIWKQYPIKGTKISSSTINSDFVVYINSKSDKKIKIRNFHSLNIDDVEKELSEAGLKTKIKYVKHSKILKKNQIIDQDIEPNTEVSEGSTISFNVSANNKMIRLPSLEDLSETKFIKFAKNNSMTIKNIGSEHDKSCTLDSYIGYKDDDWFDINKTLKYKSSCSWFSKATSMFSDFFGFDDKKKDNNSVSSETVDDKNETIDKTSDLKEIKKRATDKIWDSNLDFFSKINTTTKISFADSEGNVQSILEEALK